MTRSRIGGITGKTCSVCKVWKRLSDFAPDQSPGKFKGYRQACCQECASFIKRDMKKGK